MKGFPVKLGKEVLLKGVPWDNAQEGFSGWGSHPEWIWWSCCNWGFPWSWEILCAQLRESSSPVTLRIHVTRTPELQFGLWRWLSRGNGAESPHEGGLCGIFVLSALGEGSTAQKIPILPLQSRLGNGERGVRNICLLLLLYKLTELAGQGFGKCNSSTERGEKQVIKKAAVFCLSSLCVL